MNASSPPPDAPAPVPASGSANLEIREATKRFGHVVALADGHLDLAEGEVHALIGSNGCGKSTLCKDIAGSVRPDSGTVTIGGEPVHFTDPQDAEAAGIGIFYQELSLIPQRTVAQNLSLGREPRRFGCLVDRRAERRRAADLIALFGAVAGATLTPDALVARNVRRVHEGFRGMRDAARSVIGRHVRDSTLGMARWAERGPELEDESDLDDYMHEVAGRVGWLLTELFALDLPEVDRRKEEMMRLGREFGLALQTVNVIRGLHEDWERGWIYIPRSFLPHPDFTPEELFHGRERRVEVELSILRHLVEKADRHLAAARRYIAGISRGRHGIRLFCLLPLLFAVRTLAVSRDNPAVFERETKMTRSEVERIVRHARLFGFSNRWVAWYCGRLERV